MALLAPGAHVFIDVRILRLRRKILVFLSIVMMAVLIMGTVMYVVEGPSNGFTRIPTAMYWGALPPYQHE